MRGANLFLLSAAGLTVAGCVASNDVHVRAIADPGAKFRYGGGLLADGRAQLALGNAGLALETFRKLQREQPESADAFAGIAACYAAMGRYDIARTNYEFALAYAPNDPRLLTALASTLERLGQADQAGQVRREAARLTAPPAQNVARAEPVTPVAVPRVASVTVKVPPAPASAPKPEEPAPIEIAKAVFTQAPVDAAAAAPIAFRQVALNSNVDLAVPPPEEAPVPAPPAPEPRPAMMPVGVAASRPIPLKPAALTPTVELSMPGVEETPAPPSASRPEPAVADKPREKEIPQPVRPLGGPYLARSSLGEVALITTAGPLWVQPSPPEAAVRAEARPVPARTGLKLTQARMSDVAEPRWVPLKYAAARPNIQILNAARVQSLAARNRSVLLDRGWRKIAIGDARKVRQRSLVLYAPAREAIARRLAAHFHCKAVRAKAVQSVVVLLGRDAAARTSSRA